jgi:transposase
MLEPTRVEVPVDGRGVQRAVGERNGSLVGRAVVRGSVADPELVERATRRRFTAEYKLGVLREADGCMVPGELGALLRREGLYSSHLVTWRRQREGGALAGLTPRKRGPRGASPEQVENEQLHQRLERVQGDLDTARRVIQVQGNVCALLEELMAPKSATETDVAAPRR